MHYREVAGDEGADAGEQSVADGEEAEAGNKAAGLVRHVRLIPVFAVGGLLVQTVSEAAFAELVKEVASPFVFSLVSFTVGGIAFGLLSVVVLWKVIQHLTPLRFFWGGLLLAVPGSLLVLLPVWGVRALSGASTSLDGLGAWWILISWAAFMAVSVAIHRGLMAAVLAPIISISGLIAILFVATMTPLEVDAANSISGTARGLEELSVSCPKGCSKRPICQSSRGPPQNSASTPIRICACKTLPSSPR